MHCCTQLIQEFLSMKTTEMCLQKDIKQPPRLLTSRTVLLDLCVVLKRSYGELVWQTPPIQLKSVLKGKKVTHLSRSVVVSNFCTFFAILKEFCAGSRCNLKAHLIRCMKAVFLCLLAPIVGTFFILLNLNHVRVIT